MAKILLVEDDNNLREIYEARLQAEGYEIASARDGEEALVVAKNEHPDLVIADVMMPKISGFEMLDILRNTDGLKDVKVIMLTALGQAEDQTRADKLGADRYLVKSQVTLEDIVKVSQQLLSETGAAGVPAAAAPAADPAPAPTEPVVPDVPTPTIPVTAPPADDAPETSKQEEATVEKQIDDFVKNEPTTPPAVTATPAQDKAMDEAVDSLVASTEPAATPPAPEPVETPAETPETPASASDTLGDSATVAHKKVIKPLDDGTAAPTKSLDELVAEEDAKEKGTATPAAAETPATPATPPAKTGDFDPNSIAL